MKVLRYYTKNIEKVSQNGSIEQIDTSEQEDT